MIEAAQLCKWYGKTTALQDVTLNLEPGIWGLLGPNGSGKTSFMRSVAGQLRPSLGSLTVLGKRPFGSAFVANHIGYCPEADALYDELTAFEFVATLTRIFGYSRHEAEQRARKALAAFGLETVMNRPLKSYSRGMRQRAKLAQATAHDPQILLLDEPLNGTDPTSRQHILDQVRAHAEPRAGVPGKLVLVSTHVLHEIEALTKRLLVLVNGRLVAHGTADELRSMLDQVPHRIAIQCSHPRKLAQSLLEERAIQNIRFPSENELEIQTQQPAEVYRTLTDRLTASDYGLEALSNPDATLDALFHQLVTHGTQGAPQTNP